MLHRYYEAKLVLVLFLWHPKTKGALYLFERFLHPLLRSHEARIDSGLEESKAWLADSFTRQVNRQAGYAARSCFAMMDCAYSVMWHAVMCHVFMWLLPPPSIITHEQCMLAAHIRQQPFPF